jgi:hypothetical protein
MIVTNGLLLGHSRKNRVISRVVIGSTFALLLSTLLVALSAVSPTLLAACNDQVNRMHSIKPRSPV